MRRLRDRLGETIDQVWGTRVTDPNFAADSFAAALRIMRDPEKEIGNLQPSTDAQRQALAAAKSDIEAIGQSRLQMAFALTAPVSYPLLLTVVGWVFCLFCGFGLMSRGGVMSVLALAVGASAVASAVLLISRPFESLLRHVSRLRRPARTGPGGDRGKSDSTLLQVDEPIAEGPHRADTKPSLPAFVRPLSRAFPPFGQRLLSALLRHPSVRPGSPERRNNGQG